MKELWEHAILFYNLPLTILLGLVLVFWLVSVLGAVDLDGLDLDFDVDADVDGDGASSALSGIFGFAMRFVNAQDVPVTIILSLLSVFMWATSLLANSYLNPNHSAWIALGLFLGNFFFSAVLVKATTQPLRPFLRSLKVEDTPEPLIGLVGTVKSRVLDKDFGQVEVPRISGAPALLNAILPDGHESLVRGAQVLVFDFDAERDKYLVKANSLSEADSLN